MSESFGDLVNDLTAEIPVLADKINAIDVRIDLIKRGGLWGCRHIEGGYSWSDLLPAEARARCRDFVEKELLKSKDITQQTLDAVQQLKNFQV